MGDGIVRIYNFDSCLAGELLVFADITLGSALNLETSSIGVVLSSSVMTTKLSKPIPVGSGYAGRQINASGATD